MTKKNDFWKTIDKVKNMTQGFMNSKQKKHFKQEEEGAKKKGQKMPINMLKGIRNKIR